MCAAGAQELPPVAPQAEQPAVDGQAVPPASTPLPGLVVTTGTKKKKSKKEKIAVPASGGGGAGDGGDVAASAQGTGISTGEGSEAADGVNLGGPAISDTGTTVFDSRAVNMRTDGSGEANSFLRNLPNVQYQNDTSEDAGVYSYDIINTRPLELSINGGRTYENNFILNGVSINSVTGSVEPFPNDDLRSDTDPTPNLNAFYGLHSQTVFVPSEFIGTATVIDSNASAEYGEFQGGVVVYDLARPPTDRYHASVTYSRHTDEMVDYLLATPSGTNPLGRVAPTFTKNNLAASVGAPITNQLAFILQASRKEAETTRQKNYTYYDNLVDDNSDNIFLRFATELKTDIGRFTFDTSLTDYNQLWQSPGWRDLEMDVTTRSSTTQLEYFGALQNVVAAGIGLSDVTLKSRAYYNNSNTGNYTNSDVAYTYIANRRRKVGGAWVETFDTDRFDAWCRADPLDSLPSTATQSNTLCNEGGYGNKEMGQTDLGFNAQLRGKLLLGNFLVGGEAKSVEGRRARLGDFTYYTSFVTATGNTSTPVSPPGGTFFCQPDDAVCWSDQYARIKTVSIAYDAAETVNVLHGYAELDQTYGWFNIRGGVRLDYEDYFENINVAPRLAGSITPFDGLVFTGGYNRYYLGETLAYALRDAQPFTRTFTRNHASNGNVPDFPTAVTPRFYSFKSSDLATPFSDEYTGAVRVKDPLLGGSLRLRYVERYGRDQFASTSCGTNCQQLTNEGERYYQSMTAEYAKFWRGLSTPLLSAAGITVGTTWSEQSISRTTYFDDDESDIYILYKGKSYTPESFTAVTGNLDIPVRIGGTLSTSWFADRLWVDLSAGYNLGYQGVYDTGDEEEFNGRPHAIYDDKQFKPVLMLDLAASLAVTEQASINLHVNNLLNSPGNRIATNDNPWLLGRSFWLESALRF
jgi:hypothetical protein